MKQATLKENKSILARMKKYWLYYVLFLPGALLLFFFNYIPMAGYVLAFKDFWPEYGMFNSPWEQPLFKNFTMLFENAYFWLTVKNTLIIFFLKFITAFPTTIITALLFNELRSPRFAKFVQTVMFIPYFISWVIISGMLKKIFGVDGLVNTILNTFGLDTIAFMTEDTPFLVLLILVDLWKGIGYGMILYLASMASINSELYEAVEIDGGNRLTKMIHVSLPGMKMLISMQLVLSFSGILNAGFDQIYNLYSIPVYNVSDIIDTYIFRISFEEGENHSMSTALSLFKSVIGFVLIVIANKISDKINGESIL